MIEPPPEGVGGAWDFARQRGQEFAKYLRGAERDVLAAGNSRWVQTMAVPGAVSGANSPRRAVSCRAAVVGAMRQEYRGDPPPLRIPIAKHAEESHIKRDATASHRCHAHDTLPDFRVGTLPSPDLPCCKISQLALWLYFDITLVIRSVTIGIGIR